MSTDQAQPRKLKRGRETALDMVRSMAVLGLAVGLVLLVTWRPAPASDINPVDLAAISQGAEANAGFKIVVPTLNKDWKPTSARLEPVEQDMSKFAWHIGYVTPLGQYVAIEQSNTNLPDKFVKTWIAKSETSQPVEIEGLGWTQFFDEAGITLGYVVQLQDSILVVTGTAELSEIMAAVQAASVAAIS